MFLKSNQIKFMGLLLTSTLALSACSKNGTDDGLNQKGQKGQVQALDERPLGVFSLRGAISNVPIGSRFQTPACEENKTYGPLAIDQRLRQGDQIKSIIQNSDNGSNMSADIVESIVSVGTDFLVSEMNMNNLKTTIPSIPSELNYTQECRTESKPNGSQSAVCQAKDPSSLPQVQSESCYLARTTDDRREYSEVEGRFRLQSGTEVTAFKIVTSTSGDVECRTGDQKPIAMGKGKETKIRIVSNELLTRALYSCGGSEVFEYSLLTLDSQKIMESQKKEVLSAPRIK